MSKLILVCAGWAVAESRRNCPVCDRNDYNPVFVNRRAFMSECHYRRILCLEEADLTPKMIPTVSEDGLRPTSRDVNNLMSNIEKSLYELMVLINLMYSLVIKIVLM